MMKRFFFFLLYIQFSVVEIVTCHRFPENVPSTSSLPSGLIRKEMLDSEGKYWLQWFVDWNEQTITFNITVETTGWVGFGLSNNGKMSGADIIIGGVHNDGRTYFSDRHAVNTQVPVVDPSQDWMLLDCRENGTKTFLSVKRKLDTCDRYDYPVTENRVSLIWAYGKEDNWIRYHGQVDRGSYNVYLLDPNYAPTIVRDVREKNPRLRDTTGISVSGDVKTWTIQMNQRLPRNSTSYLCSIHKAPSLSRKHHIIGYDIHFGNEASRDRVHHLSLFKCNVPRAWVPQDSTPDSIFGQFVRSEPQACTNLLNPHGGPIPTQWCTEIYLFWGIGGQSFFNPEHVGFPLGNDLGESEFFLFQPHYDNPEMQEDIVDLRLDLFYTSRLRPNEGGLLTILHQIPGQPESFLLPPNSNNRRIYGHCSTECTKRILGQKGEIKVYGALLHSHWGKQMRVRQFREGKELPPIIYDDNYSYEYQHCRNLRKEAEVMAGDQITVDCNYDTSWANGSTVVGGYTRRQEMCIAFLFYYNKIWDHHYCASQISSAEKRQRFLNGVGNVTWSEDNFSWIVSDPPQWKGLTIQEVSDNFVEWDETRKADVQREMTYGSHVGTCYREAYARTVPVMPLTKGVSQDDYIGPVQYPLDVLPYTEPESQCDF